MLTEYAKTLLNGLLKEFANTITSTPAYVFDSFIAKTLPIWLFSLSASVWVAGIAILLAFKAGILNYTIWTLAVWVLYRVGIIHSLLEHIVKKLRDYCVSLTVRTTIEVIELFNGNPVTAFSRYEDTLVQNLNPPKEVEVEIKNPDPAEEEEIEIKKPDPAEEEPELLESSFEEFEVVD